MLHGVEVLLHGRACLPQDVEAVFIEGREETLHSFQDCFVNRRVIQFQERLR